MTSDFDNYIKEKCIREELQADKGDIGMNEDETVTLDTVFTFKEFEPKVDFFEQAYVHRDGEKILLKDLWEEHKKFKLYKQAIEEARGIMEKTCVYTMAYQDCIKCKSNLAKVINKIDEVLESEEE